MSKVDEMAIYIRKILAEQLGKGSLFVDIRAGDLWKLLQVELGLTGITQVCGAMRTVASEMPSRWMSDQSIKNSTTVLYRYYKDPATARLDNQFQIKPIPQKRSSSVVGHADSVKQNKSIVVKSITVEELEETAERVAEDLRYGAEGRIICDCLEQFPSNGVDTDDRIIAMKIALIDMTNSTNLNRHLGKILLTDLIAKIKHCNFDERVAAGDQSLVGELSDTGAINLFSFFSKYCVYHNYYLHKKDDFVIFDGVVKDHIGEYISEYEYKGRTYSSTEIKNLIYNEMRTSFDYVGYKALVDTVLEINNIHCPYKRRKLDWFIWYNNRTSKREDNE